MPFLFPLTLGPFTEEGSSPYLSTLAKASQMSRFISYENVSEMHREKVPWFRGIVLGGQCLFAFSVWREVFLAFSFSKLSFHCHCKYVNFRNCPMFRFSFRNYGKKGEFPKIEKVASTNVTVREEGLCLPKSRNCNVINLPHTLHTVSKSLCLSTVITKGSLRTADHMKTMNTIQPEIVTSWI